MEQFGYSEQLAREEVVANTLPAILNDEAYVKKLVSMDRTLAERIRDFIADFVSFVNETLRALEGEASWKQMRSIREDTEMLSAIGELFDVALEGVPGGPRRIPARERNFLGFPAMIFPPAQTAL